MGFPACCLYRLGSWLSQSLPLGLCYALADILSDAHFVLRRRPRRALLANLAVATGTSMSPDDRRRLARTIFRNFGRSVVDFLRVPSRKGGAFRQDVKAEGLDRLENALRRGRGVVLLTGHVGSWELGGAYLSILGYPVNAIAQEHGDPQVTEFFNRRRREAGIRVLPMDETGSSLRGFLERGECIALLGDWDAAGRGAWARFFGRPARLPWAYVNLAARAGGRILPGVALRDSRGGYRVCLGEPIEPNPSNTRETLQGCLAVLERYIRENLTQWFAFNPIWPEEAADGRLEA